MTDEERELRLVERELEEAPEPPPRSPEQRERMRREFMAALEARVKRDAAGAQPRRKSPPRIAMYATAFAGVAAAASLVLWLWIRPRGDEDKDGSRAGAPVMAISAEADAGAPPSPTMTPRRPRRPAP